MGALNSNRLRSRAIFGKRVQEDEQANDFSRAARDADELATVPRDATTLLRARAIGHRAITIGQTRRATDEMC
jgi:hypothetical protein